MRNVKWGVVAVLSMIGMEAASANIVLEDFNGFSVPGTVVGSGGGMGNLSTSGLQSSFYFNSAGIVTATGTELHVEFDGFIQTFQLNLGMILLPGQPLFGITPGSAMNADWSNVTGIKLNISGMTGSAIVQAMEIYSAATNGDITGISGQQLSIGVDTGSVIIPLSGLTSNWLFDANIADVDALQLTFLAINVGGPAVMKIDSIELVTVPEPATALLATLGMGVAVMRRRRNH